MARWDEVVRNAGGWGVRVPGERSAKLAAAAVAIAAALGAMAWYVNRSARAAQREVPPRGRFVEVDGVRVHYLERGEGPVVAILHGNGSRIEEVLASGVVDRLARDHRVLLFDRPGFGYTARPGGRDWDVAGQARLFARALDRLGVARATIVGHSWSTLVGLVMALDRRDRVAGLVLASGYYFPTFRPDFLLASLGTWPIVGPLTRHTTTPVFGRLAWPRVLRALFRPREPSAAMRAITPWAFLRPQSLHSQSQEGGMLMREAAKLAPRYGEVRVPVAILAGELDPWIPPERHSERLYAAIDGSTYELLPGAGHMLHHDEPDAVVEAVLDVEQRATQVHGVKRALVPDAAALLPHDDASLGHAD